MRRLLEYAGLRGHIYPLSLLCYEVMPPLQQAAKEIGEQRLISFHGVDLSVTKEIKYRDITAHTKNADEVWCGGRWLCPPARVWNLVFAPKKKTSLCSLAWTAASPAQVTVAGPSSIWPLWAWPGFGVVFLTGVIRFLLNCNAVGVVPVELFYICMYTIC